MVPVKHKRRDILGNRQSHRNFSAVLQTIGKVFQKLRSEEVVSSVSHCIYYSVAGDRQGVGTIPGAGLQIGIGFGNRIDQSVQWYTVRQILDCVYRIVVAWSDLIGYCRFFRVLGMIQLEVGRAFEITVIVKNLVDHLHPHFRSYI